MIVWYTRAFALLCLMLVRPFTVWAYRYTRPSRHHYLRGVWQEPVDVVIARSSLDRLRRANLSVDTMEMSRRMLTAAFAS